MTTQEVCFGIWIILLHFQTRAAKNCVMLKTTLNFALSDPLWKLGDGWARSPYKLLKLYLRPNNREHPEYIWWPSTAQVHSAVNW